MSNGKNIEIKIAATGGDQAAKEIEKVADASESLGKGGDGSAGFGGMLDGVPERVEEVTDKIEDLNDGVDDLKKELGPVADKAKDAADGLGKAADKADDLEKNVGKIKQAAMGEAFANAAGKVAGFAGKIAGAGKELDSAFGAENAQKIREFAGAIEEVANGASTVGTAFATGGPVAAGLTTVSLLAVEAGKSYADMATAQQGADDAAAMAAEMQAKLNDMLAYGADAYYGAATAAEKLKEITDASTESIGAETTAIKKRNEILNADDAAYRAKRDREDASAIRNGANPENVKIKRVQDDEAAALRKLDREDEQKRAGLGAAKNAVLDAQEQVEKGMVAPDATPEKTAAAEAVVAELRKRLEKMEEEISQSERINGAKRTEIRERSAGKVEDLVDRRGDRKAAEEKQAADAAARAAEAGARRAEQTKTGQRDGAAKAGRDAVALLPDGTRKEFADSVKAVSKRLQDGDQGGELAELAGLMRDLASSTITKTSKIDGEVAALRKQIGILTQRQRNS